MAVLQLRSFINKNVCDFDHNNSDIKIFLSPQLHCKRDWGSIDHIWPQISQHQSLPLELALDHNFDYNRWFRLLFNSNFDSHAGLISWLFPPAIAAGVFFDVPVILNVNWHQWRNTQSRNQLIHWGRSNWS